MMFMYFALGVLMMTSFHVCSPYEEMHNEMHVTAKPRFASTASSNWPADRGVRYMQKPIIIRRPVSATPNVKAHHVIYHVVARNPRITYFISSNLTAPNLHECVPCHADDQARKDFDSCLLSLSRKLKEIMRSCCANEFSIDSCKNITSGGTDYDAICRNPDKGLNVERCFFYEAREDSDGLASYVTCKERINDKYCVAVSSSSKMIGVMNWMIVVLLISLY